MAVHYFTDKVLRLNMFDSNFDVGHRILVTYMTYILKQWSMHVFFLNRFKMELTGSVYCYKKQLF